MRTSSRPPTRLFFYSVTLAADLFLSLLSFAMNGAQHTKDSTAQKLPQGAPASPAPSNGSSAAINKKRKKDGLKPIITADGPGYVLSCFSFFVTARNQHPGISDFSKIFPLFLSPPTLSVSFLGFFPLSVFLETARLPTAPWFRMLDSCDWAVSAWLKTHCAAQRMSSARWRGATGGTMGPTIPLSGWRGKAHILLAHALTPSHHGARVAWVCGKS